MKARTGALPVRPDRSPWFRVEMDEVLLTFRTPSYGQAQSVQEAVVAAQKSENIDALERALGVFMALCWDDDRWELEHPEDGGACFQELRDAGWTFGGMGELFAHATKLIQSELIPESEVAGTLRFFAPGEQTERPTLRSA